ncbi:nuclear transport factor 2 family protein [Adhaeribacter arboris]|uniref:Nuclear transport factor 2 family protein n=1 Tax=Adhaeribacter arboris TaxID=2072846 RepID=A0A2T2YNZ4_9BACT|nr:nuclear transport factor 2 family protein [Adhaeribacter arboris]PSR57199.1 nuclear transport factor 2 family protein [Adhaeribacter arboris]
MLTFDFAQKFAREWIASWNAHDLNAVLAYYSADFVIETPMTLLMKPNSQGKLANKEAVKAYWTIGLQRIPDLEFKLLDVLIGMNTLTIYYLNKATKNKAAEMLFFNEELQVCKSFVHYS